MDWDVLIAAFGLYLVFEGLMSFASPDALKQLLKQIIEMPSSTLRMIGAVSISIGLLLLYLARQI
ncbi:MAG: DUF2065 domain-containing protein [Proteobacteria bacterium]|nr:DUF2065 domain-containing protein [Pseudomonadota bacterium]